MAMRSTFESLFHFYPHFLRRATKRARLVNGRLMARLILDEVRLEVEDMKTRHRITPGLATILVGTRPDSIRYIEMKQAVARSAGLAGFTSSLPESASHEDVLRVIDEYNADDTCHGILLQLPLPTHLDPRALLGAIRVDKDVECFHPLNTGRLTCWRETVIAPCTPRGVMEMLRRLDVQLGGTRVAVIGESNVVGIPMALMLNAARATVTLVHLDTPDPKACVRDADVVIVACGVPELVRKDWIKPGAVVIDVGINFVKDATRPAGFRLVGDVSPDVREVAGIVTPVPGGVGPMTVAMLMRNCVDMAFLRTKWAEYEDVIHEGSAADNARRMHGAFLDMASGSSVPDDVSQHMMETAGASISEAELLTIISDTEHNAYNVLSFLEIGQSRDRTFAHGHLKTQGSDLGGGVLQPAESAVAAAAQQASDSNTREDRVTILDAWHQEVHGQASLAANSDHLLQQRRQSKLLVKDDELTVPFEGFHWWEDEFDEMDTRITKSHRHQPEAS